MTASAANRASSRSTTSIFSRTEGVPSARRTSFVWPVAHLEPQPGQTILELGAGTGEMGYAAAPLDRGRGAADLHRPPAGDGRRHKFPLGGVHGQSYDVARAITSEPR